jgi:fructose-1,6-bisphosphatase/inositol monophosphatase family enzyme
MNMNLIISAARKTTPLLLRDYNEIQYLRHSPKSMNEFIDNSKLRTGQILTQEYQKYFPDHLIINVQNFTAEPECESYILFDPLEGEVNIKNNLNLFAVCTLIVTKKNNASFVGVVLNFPALDLICCASSKNGVWLEHCQNLSKVKMKHSKSGNIVVIDQIEKNTLESACAFGLNLENIRSFGSKAYSIMQLALGGASTYLTKDNDIFYTKINNLIIQELAYFKAKHLGLNIYSAQKVQTLRTLSLKKSDIVK